MRWLTGWANRFMPIAFMAMALLSIVQFVMAHTPSGKQMDGVVAATSTFLHAHAWGLLAVAALCWAGVFVGYFHEKQTAKIGARVRDDATQPRGWMMDILDRLTNRQVLEQKLAREPEAIFIDAEQLAAALKGKVIGQDGVCDDMAAQIRRRLALQQRGKPVGVFMLAGPPGTGKTYLAKCLATELQRKLLHFDMTQFSSGGHAATQLFGAAKGYVGSDTYGKLTSALRDCPDAIVLLDEIEKAHPEVHKKFLTAWNDGFVTEASNGQQISTTRAIFVLTTNAATDSLQELSKTYAKDPDELRRTSVNALREAGFAPEVLNRIDRVLVFKPLLGLDIARVTALEIEAMIKGYGLEVSANGIDPDVLLDMMHRQDRLGTGASSRDLVRAVEESIADALIQAKQDGHARVSLHSVDGAVVAQPES